MEIKPYALTGSNRAQMLDRLYAMVRNSCRTDSKRWVLDMAAANRAEPYPKYTTGAARIEAYARGNAQIALAAGEMEDRRFREKEIKKVAGLERLKQLAIEKKAMKNMVVDAVTGEKVQLAPKPAKPFNNALDAIAVLLKEVEKKMDIKEVTKILLSRNWWQSRGKTPSSTLYSSVYRETKLPNSRFTLAKGGIVGLK